MGDVFIGDEFFTKGWKKQEGCKMFGYYVSKMIAVRASGTKLLLTPLTLSMNNLKSQMFLGDPMFLCGLTLFALRKMFEGFLYKI